MRRCFRHDWQEEDDCFICRICGKQTEKNDEMGDMNRMQHMERPRTMFEELGFNSTIQ